jgi:membrane-bound serine protease (ClpP class)
MRKILLLIAVLIGVLQVSSVSASPSEPVILLEVDGVINTFTVRYLDRGLQNAEEIGAQVVIIQIDTPGGLDTSMREIIQMLLNANVPVAVFVSPEGARATSAGMFILLAADIAAMAPSTHVGAAHPVALGEQPGEIVQNKLTEDAAALVRSIAETRGRNAQWAELAVKENLAVTATEALDLGVIDLIAEDLDDLLQQISGGKLLPIEIDPDTTPIIRDAMNLVERFFHVITEPNIAYLLLTLGAILLFAEFADPGLSAAGVGAGLAFIIAFLGLGSLPINWAAVGLIALAFVVFLVGLLTDTEPIVTILGLVPFVLGSTLLFSPFRASSPAAPDVRVNPWVIGIMALTIIGFSFFILRAILAAIRKPPQSGPQRLIGLYAETLSDLNPLGQVRVGTENWSAISVEGEIPANSQVMITGIKGVRLEVSPVGKSRDQREKESQ